MVASFSSIFSSSLQRVRTCILPVLLTAVVVGAVNALPAALLPQQTEGGTDAASVLEAILQGDEAQIEAMVEQAEETEDAPPLTAEEGVIAAALMILSIIVSIFGGFYLMIVIAEGYSDPAAGLRRLPSLLLPIAGTTFWMFIVSYIWVPLLPAVGLLLWDGVQYGQPTPTAIGVAVLLFFVSAVVALVRMPRLFFAPIILVREKTGITESVRLSEQRTRGYWSKIVLNNLAFAIIGFIVMMLLFAILGSLFVALAFAGQMGAVAGSFVMVLGQLLINAWNQAFHVELALTIFDNPRE
jgi:MFS family permease